MDVACTAVDQSMHPRFRWRKPLLLPALRLAFRWTLPSAHSRNAVTVQARYSTSRTGSHRHNPAMLTVTVADPTLGHSRSFPCTRQYSLSRPLAGCDQCGPIFSDIINKRAAAQQSARCLLLLSPSTSSSFFSSSLATVSLTLLYFPLSPCCPHFFVPLVSPSFISPLVLLPSLAAFVPLHHMIDMPLVPHVCSSAPQVAALELCRAPRDISCCSQRAMIYPHSRGVKPVEK